MKCRDNLELFVDQFVPHLAPVKRPAFHREMLDILQRSNAMQDVKQDVKKEEGGDDPLGGGDKLLVTATQNSTQNENQLDNEPVLLSQFPEKREATQPAEQSAMQSVTQPATQTAIQSENFNRILFIAPRGFSKSTICSRFYPLWLACYGMKKDIFLVSATISLAKENLRYIRNEIENNETIKAAFGDLKSDKWTEEQVNLSNGVIIRAKGREFQIRGFRPDCIICDDLEDEEVLYSKEQRDKLENWFFRTLIPTLKPDQQLVYIGTKLHQFALIASLEKKKEFLKRSYKALVEGKSIWEEMWSAEKLRDMRDEIGIYAFEAEYQNNPLSLQEQPIKPHYLEGVVVKEDVTLTCLALDPAISERESADYRAISIFGRTDSGMFKEVYTEKGRWSVDEQVEKVIWLFETYHPDRILIEEVAFQKILRSLIVNKARDRGLYLPISTAELGVGKNKRPKDKMTRLLQIVPLFEQRLVEVRSPDLRDELLAFPFGDYDDMVDCCVYSLYWLMQERGGRVMPKKYEMKLPIKTKDSFYVSEPRPGVYVAKIGMPPIRPFITQGRRLINYDKPIIE